MGELKNIKIVDDFDEITIHRRSLPDRIHYNDIDSCAGEFKKVHLKDQEFKVHSIIQLIFVCGIKGGKYEQTRNKSSRC